MNFSHHFYLFQNSVGEHWHMNRRSYLWLFVFFLAGVIFALTNCFKVEDFTRINIAIIDISFSRIIDGRFSFFVTLFSRMLIFAVCFFICWGLSKTRRFGFLCHCIPFYFGYVGAFTIFYMIAMFGFAGIMASVCCFVIYLVIAAIVCVLCALFLSCKTSEINLGHIALCFAIAILVVVIVECILFGLLLSGFVFV